MWGLKKVTSAFWWLTPTFPITPFTLCTPPPPFLSGPSRGLHILGLNLRWPSVKEHWRQARLCKHCPCTSIGEESAPHNNSKLIAYSTVYPTAAGNPRDYTPVVKGPQWMSLCFPIREWGLLLLHDDGEWAGTGVRSLMSHYQPIGRWSQMCRGATQPSTLAVHYSIH